MKRAVISTNSLNSYGSRVLSSGMDIEQYKRNPVLLYMHGRGQVIGYIKDIQVDGDTISGEPVFDEATELSRMTKKQWEFGSLKMLSAGIDVLRLSGEAQDLLPGQTAPTVTKSKLFEVSVVDVGANDDALVMTREGKAITLGAGGANPLPVLTQQREDNQPTNKTSMDQKVMALQLGLPETASEAEITQALNALKASKAQVETLQQEKDALTLAAITAAVETAVKEKRLGEDKKAHFIELGKVVGLENLNTTLGAMAPQVRLSAMLSHQGSASTPVQATYTKLSEVPAEELKKMRAEDKATYQRLFKSEYGYECEIED